MSQRLISRIPALDVVRQWRSIMIFKETEIFTSLLPENLTDDDYAQLQHALIVNPEAGAVIRNSGGLRKLRWQSSFNDKGKRSGIRIIYYHITDENQILMLYVYSKATQDDLSSTELQILRKVSERLNHG